MGHVHETRGVVYNQAYRHSFSRIFNLNDGLLIGAFPFWGTGVVLRTPVNQDVLRLCARPRRTGAPRSPLSPNDWGSKNAQRRFYERTTVHYPMV